MAVSFGKFQPMSNQSRLFSSCRDQDQSSLQNMKDKPGDVYMFLLAKERCLWALKCAPRGTPLAQDEEPVGRGLDLYIDSSDSR